MRIHIVMVFAVLLGLLAGCQNIDRKLAEGVKEGQKQYNRSNYLGAERVLSGAIATDPDSTVAAEGYYIRGLARLKLLRPGVAEQDFQRALRLSDREDLRANAHVCLGSIAWEDHDWDRAYQHYRAAEGSLPSLSPSDWILFRLASSAQRSGRWEEGKKYFARLLREFPDSETAKAARRNLNYDFFAIQVGAFSSAQGAFARVQELRRWKVPARVYPLELDGRALKVVYVGRYNDYYQASKGLVKIKRIVPEARIVP